MFSKVLQPSDYELISKIMTHANFNKASFVHGTYINLDFETGTDIHDFAQRLPYVQDKFLDKFVSNFKNKLYRDIAAEQKGRFSDIVKELSAHCQRYNFYPSKTFLNKDLVLELGSNVLVKTENFYNALNDKKIYANEYSNYRLINRTELVGGIFDDEKDNFTNDEYPVFKWIPYLYNFTLPEYEDETLDAKFINLAIGKLDRSKIKDLIMADLAELDHDNYERFKIIVDSANIAVRALNDKVQEAKNDLTLTIEHAVSWETTRRSIKDMVLNIAEVEGADSFDMAKDVENPCDFFDSIKHERNLRLKLEGLFAHFNYCGERDYIAELLMAIYSFNKEWEPSQELIGYILEQSDNVFHSNKVFGQINRLLNMAVEINPSRWEDLKISRLKSNGEKENLDDINKIIFNIIVIGKGIDIAEMKTILDAYRFEGIDSVIGITLEETTQTVTENKVKFQEEKDKQDKEYFSRHYGLEKPVTKDVFARFMPSRKVSQFI